MEFFSLIGDWDIYVDDVYYPSPYNPPYVINTEFEGILQCASDGFADFYNLDSVPHRIMFVPIIDGNASYMLRPENQNQSFLELDDGSIVFCLAPAGCQPTTVFINPDSNELGALTGVSYAVSYQLDDGVTSGEMQTAVFYIEPYDHEDTATYSRLLEALANAIGLSYHGGGGGSWPWSIGYSQGAGFNQISGGDGSVDSAPQTLKLFLSSSPSIDAVDVLFGDAVTVHSCGAQNYPGV